MTLEALTEALTTGFHRDVRVRVRRPNRILQVELPAFLADGDGVQIFVQPTRPGEVLLSDLGMTVMRLSYRRSLTSADSTVLTALGERNGFAFKDGAFEANIREEEILAGVLGLTQIQSQADVMVKMERSKLERAERFRSVVRSMLEVAFHGRIRFDVTLDDLDPSGLYPLDAVIHGALEVYLAMVSSDIDAERAVARRHYLDPHIEKRHRWAVLPRDIEALSTSTRKRLLQTHLAPVPVFSEGRDQLVPKLTDLTI